MESNSNIQIISESHAPVMQQENPWLGVIQQSIEKNLPFETIEKFIKLQREEEDRQAERAFNNAMSQLQSNMPEISKTGRASFKTKDGKYMEYNFDQLNDICNAIRPLLFDAGLSYSFKQLQENGSITVLCTIKHRLGHSESNKMTAPPDATGLKNPIQQVASTISYLQRYTLKAGLGIASSDDDGAASNQASVEKDEKIKFTRWMATAKIEMGKQESKELLDEWYKKAVGYSSVYNQKFVIELQNEYETLISKKGW